MNKASEELSCWCFLMRRAGGEGLNPQRGVDDIGMELYYMSIVIRATYNAISPPSAPPALHTDAAR